ncbi:CHAD domain-containing protein [Streptomyces sp. BK239]|uniref:CHAD domain-containing protein n=1 Tax=Streptomyces sp. BK239 TaxID=2512155 RepID=UPI00102CA027|nr:CHAD domain-containing protein [Streptomyces sp. BK239]RZU14884.1 CHAD domain-containing protein [Streptomyces sp. BK239]
MAQRHHELTDSTAAPVAEDALTGYLRAQAVEFLRALRLHQESGGAPYGGGGAAGRAQPRTGGAGHSPDAARALRRAARRISGTLHTFRPLLDPGWSEGIRPELSWLSGTLAQEHACEARLERLLLALHRLSGTSPTPPTAPVPSSAPARQPADLTEPAPAGAPTPTSPASPTATVTAVTAAATLTSPHPLPDRAHLTVGAVKAGALLDRQLNLARTRAHSAALQALGSSRFHAVADQVAVLASEVPLAPAAVDADLRSFAAAAAERLTDAVAALPLVTAGHPYNAEALVHGLSPDPAPHPQDTPWHQVRLLLRLHRYALEVLHTGDRVPVDARLLAAGEALDRHRDAAEAAAAAAQAARTPRIAPATAYALGVLHADQRHEVEAARYAFQRSWQKQTVGTST